jgi:hypothetical protein
VWVSASNCGRGRAWDGDMTCQLPRKHTSGGSDSLMTFVKGPAKVSMRCSRHTHLVRSTEGGKLQTFLEVFGSSFWRMQSATRPSKLHRLCRQVQQLVSRVLWLAGEPTSWLAGWHAGWQVFGASPQSVAPTHSRVAALAAQGQQVQGSGLAVGAHRGDYDGLQRRGEREGRCSPQLSAVHWLTTRQDVYMQGCMGTGQLKSHMPPVSAFGGSHS